MITVALAIIIADHAGLSKSDKIKIAEWRDPAERCLRRHGPPPLDNSGAPSRPTWRFCVVTCVLTLASLPVLGGVGRCRLGIGEGQGTACRPA
jgi:hypothetical protein